MTPDGYVPVQEIINSTHKKLRGVTLEAIQEVVASNDKQRFKLEDLPRHLYYDNTNDNDMEDTSSSSKTTILCIRANQGHSIKTIDPNRLLTKLSSDALRALPCIVHGTYEEAWQSIQEQGLRKQNRNHIHFATGLPEEPNGVISGMRRTCTIYIYLHASNFAYDGIDFFKSDNGVILTAGVVEGTLPPDYFSHVTDAQGNILLDNRTPPDTSTKSLANNSES
jgi:2'-phosphotransferase